MKKFLVFVFLVGFIGISNFAYAGTANLTIRDGASIIFSGEVTIPDPGTVELEDNEGAPHSINTESVLALLHTADLSSTDFNISNLHYYSSFGSLYLKCITGSAGEKCDNWQYAVNGSYPGVGMENNILSGGENIYVFYGQQYRVSLGKSSITTADTLSVVSEKYNYENNTWEGRSGVTVGLTQPNPNDPWSPTEVVTVPADESGRASFSSISEGAYSVGIKEDFYFPTESLNVAAISFSGGGAVAAVDILQPAVPVEKDKFNTGKAFEFIISQQKEDGSFGEDIYTDWVALALASGNHQEEVIKLIRYLSGLKMESSLLTDYERRAMALMSLGLSPYSTNGINYIGKITEGFDGAQFGDSALVNDDIFALIVLQKSGYSKEEKMMKGAVNHILFKQKENGSWEDSIDVTAASIQALYPFREIDEVKNAVIKAKDYLKQGQKPDGGWGNVSSTAWAMGAILALEEEPDDWEKNGNTPADFLTAYQEVDGGIRNEHIQNRLWETAYASAALSGKEWSKIMQNFDRIEQPGKEKEEKTEEKINIAKIEKDKTKKSIQKGSKIQLSENTGNSDEKNLAGQNVASAVSALNNKAEPNKGENKSWFRRFLGKIFGF